MAKKKQSVVLTELDLNMFSEQLRNSINAYLPEESQLTGKEIIAVGPGQKLLEVRTPNPELGDAGVYNPELIDEFKHDHIKLTDKDQIKHVCGYITFAKILRTALSTFSWQFIEWMLVNYGPAFNEGELQLGEELSEDFVLDNSGKEGMIGIRREFLTRWVEKGVVCKGDVAIREELRPVDPEDKKRTKLPINYPMLIVGQVIFFNQTVPTPYMTIGRAHPEDELAPVSVGAIIYESLGLAEVDQKGPEAVFTYGGIHYHADPLGVRELEHASKSFH
ncbi:hypothetical protein pVa21_005 [Vibrio phage pVa-21]|nr:hypothetical protein pVa21_005 [Vibrio phage pVa-21]